MSQEQDRYDLDEMMDRLKKRSTDGSPESGELVTREDGSQAIRVRRRKRRSHQPHKERQRRIRMIQVTAGLVVALLLLLLLGFMTVYVNTAPYRNQLIGQLGVSIGSEVELNQFRMNPTGANANGVEMEWPAGNVLDRLSMRMVSADVSPLSVLTGKLTGDELSAQTATLVMSLAQEGQARRIAEPSPTGPPIRFKQCSVNDLQVHFATRDAGVLRLIGSEASLAPSTTEQPALLRMSGGDLRAHDWPMLRLDRAYIQIAEDRAQIIGASFLHPDDNRGSIELLGELSPYNASEPSVLELKADFFLLSGVLGDALGGLIQGRVDSDPEAEQSMLEVDFGQEAGVRLSMPFRASDDEPFVLENLPVLFALSQVLGDEWFSRPDFRDGAQGRVLRQAGRTEILGLDLLRDQRMALRGHLIHEGGALSGKFEIGLAVGMIQAAENQALEAMFGSPVQGFRWLEIEVSGSPSAPLDNFSQLYEQALSGLQSPPAATPEKPGNSFEQLTQPRH